MPNRLNILVLSDFDVRNAGTIADFLYSFNAYSRHNCYYYHDVSWLQPGLDFSRYDVIVIFWSCWWFWGITIHPRVAEDISRSRALKVLFLQDEYRTVRRNNALAARLGVQLVFSCADEKDFDFFYPRAAIPTLQAVYPALTGYVPQSMEGLQTPPFDDRPIDIGYRSRAMGYHLGDLAREKLTVAQRWQRLAAEYGFVADISVFEEDRLYGRRWLEFLRSCKFTLGSGSGASVIDLDGTVQARCAAYRRAHPAAGYDEVRERFFADLDGRVVIDTVSPRVFEAVAYGNVLVLHEGPYGGLVRPDEHYIAVKKDYSNIAGVVERMRDRGYCARLRAAAYRDLIASGRYSYRAFVRYFDERVEAHAPAPAAVPAAGAPAAGARPPSKARFYLANYVRRGQGIIPRGTRFVRIPRPTGKGIKKTFQQYRRPVLLLFVALAALWDLPVLRRALGYHLRRPRWWHRLAAPALWRDVFYLGLMRCVRSRELMPLGRFELQAHRRDDDASCLLVSVPVADEPGADDRRAVTPPAPPVVPGTDPCRRVVWERTAHGTLVTIRLGHTAAFTFDMGLRLEYWFRDAAALLASAGSSTEDLVREVLDPRPCGLCAGRGLRQMVALYALPNALTRPRLDSLRWLLGRCRLRPAARRLRDALVALRRRLARRWPRSPDPAAAPDASPESRESALPRPGKAA